MKFSIMELAEASTMLKELMMAESQNPTGIDWSVFEEKQTYMDPLTFDRMMALTKIGVNVSGELFSISFDNWPMFYSANMDWLTPMLPDQKEGLLFLRETVIYDNASNVFIVMNKGYLDTVSRQFFCFDWEVYFVDEEFSLSIKDLDKMKVSWEGKSDEELNYLFHNIDMDFDKGTILCGDGKVPSECMMSFAYYMS